MIGVDDVHRTGASSVHSRLAAEQLGQEGLGVGSHRQEVPVSAIRACDSIAVAQHACETHGDRFLAGVEVRRSVDLPPDEETLHPFFEAADDEHAPVQLERDVALELEGRGSRGVHGYAVLRVNESNPTAASKMTPIVICS